MWNPMEAMGMGHRNDSLIAHITPQEAQILKMLGGKGTVNPHTGFLQFYDSGGDGSDSEGADSDSTSDSDDGGRDAGGPEGSGAGSGDANAEGTGEAGTGPEGGSYDSGEGGFTGAYHEGGVMGETLSEIESGLAAMGGIENDSMGNVASAINAQDMDIGPQNMGMFDKLGAKARSTFEGLMDDPMSAMPSYATLGTILGAISPVPFGSMVGNFLGKQVDTHGFKEMTPGDLAVTATEERGIGNAIPDEPAAPAEEPAGLMPTQSAAPALMPDYAASKYMKNAAWRSAADRGTGGGGLSRLLRG